MTKRNDGPKPIGAVIGNDLLARLDASREAHRRRIEAAARPGETFEMPRPVKQGSQLVAEPAE